MAMQKKAKLFVHGLHWTVGSRKLREYFAQFGPLDFCQVKFDFVSGFSKGYGFVEFKEHDDAAKVLSEPKHILVKPFIVRKSFYEPGEDPKGEE